MFNKQCSMQKEGEGFLSEPDIINDLNSFGPVAISLSSFGSLNFLL